MTMQQLSAGRAGSRPARWVALVAALAAIVCLMLAGAAPAASAQSELSPTVTQTFTNQDGTPDTQAGSHPYEATTTINFATNTNGKPIENVKDVQVNLPPGFIGNPQAVPTCTVQQLDTGACPSASQVGQLDLMSTQFARELVPLYNMVPPPGMPAQFGAPAPFVNAFLDISIRTGATTPTAAASAGDYGITASSSDISTDLSLFGLQVILWGVPADPSHDSQRTCPQSSTSTTCSAGTAPTPFLTMPTRCQGPLTTTLQADSWLNPGSFEQASSSTQDSAGNLVGITGCGQLVFNPTLSVQSDTASANSPAGVNVDVHVPQAANTPTALATPTLDTAAVTLPAGMALSPAAASGLQACSEAEFGYGNGSAAACPDGSMIGSAEIDSPLLPDPLTGGIYLAQQNSNPFNSTFAIYLAVQADAVVIKLPGDVQANPQTGQLTATFTNNPQLPFTDLKLDFFGGPGAALDTPASCGTFTATGSFTPYSAPDSGGPATASSSFPISSGCGGGFSPTFTAGTTDPQAGAFSPFVLSFSRAATDQTFSGLTAQLPLGMLAKVGTVPLCSDAAAGAGTCPDASQVGTVAIGAGPGPDPFFLPGKVYLTGGYKGAPFGLAVVVPAVAGPLNLGTVVVRQQLRIDPTTAQVTVVSDPFPTILDGVPLDIQRVDVNLNRSGFTVNPTSCNPMAVTGTLTSGGGLSHPVSSRFQVGGCQDIGFSPKLAIALTGKGQTRSGAHPALTATLTNRSGRANIKTARVTLPLSLALDPKNSNHVCPAAAANAVHGGAVGCPASTVVGTASAVTPLLSRPLTGKVYLVQGLRTNAKGQKVHTLPSLLVPLRGQIALDLRAQTSVSDGKLVTTFASIPDAPVSKFTLHLGGGRKGILVITGRGQSICHKAQVGAADLSAHSGTTSAGNMKLSTPCR